jgi:hypothetical protein
VITVIVVVAVVLLVVIVGAMLRSRRSSDTVDSFRRGLDALSPEARRPVVDQVQRVSRPEDELDTGASEIDDAGPDDDPNDTGGGRGT